MEYRIIRSARRTLSLEVAPDGSVVVRCPQRLPEREIERIVAAKEAWIRKMRERLRTSPRARSFTEDEILAMRREAQEKLIPKTMELARAYGFSVQSVRITAAKKRFGSCSSENRICLSLYLMQYPAEAIDYVILHELCHTVEHNHSARFYALLAHYMPDHRARRALLR